MSKITIFDIDGTLTDIKDRVIYIKGEKKNWGNFWKGMENDRPKAAIINLCNTMFEAGFYIILCTGRYEKYRKITENWLSKYEVKYHEMRMRNDDDKRDDHIVKKSLIKDIDINSILFIVEDRYSVVKMWRKLGITCLHCNDEIE
jgi:uncharacterized HAD superfamily protein